MMKQIEVEVGGKCRQVWAQLLGSVLWIHDGGRTFTYEPPVKQARGRGKGGAADTSGRVAAPMPGKVTKIHVNVGDTVQAQQVLLVLEAMKMEYTLKAPQAGVILTLDCQEGQQVTLGQVLARLDLPKENAAESVTKKD
jgi:3-methylcrotonyl-CoA carboxylase alpha subunit